MHAIITTKQLCKTSSRLLIKLTRRLNSKPDRQRCWLVFCSFWFFKVDHWGSHGMAVHPIRLINVVGALDFAKPSHNQYLQVSASIFWNFVFWAWFTGWLFAFSLGSALKGFSFVSGAGPSSAKTRPQKTEGRMSRCWSPVACHSCWNFSLLLHSRYVRLGWSGDFWWG